MAQCYNQHLWKTSGAAQPTKVGAARRLSVVRAAVSKGAIARFVSQAYERSLLDDGDVDEDKFEQRAWELYAEFKGGPATKAPQHLYRMMSLRGSDVQALKDGRPIHLNDSLVSFSYANMEETSIAEEAFKRFGSHDAPCSVIIKVTNPGWRLLNIPELYKMCDRKAPRTSSVDIDTEKEVIVIGARLPSISGDNIIAYKERDKPWVFK